MNLKSKRKEAGLTQAETARALGVTQVSYSNYEIGKRNPKPAMLRKMAEFFNCTIDELVGDADDTGRI